MNDRNTENQQKAIFMNEQVQAELNTPLATKEGVSDENKKFMEMVLSFIDDEKIKLHKPSSIINKTFYSTLPEKEQGKADLEAVNLLSAVREIKDLYDAGFTDTFQMENLLERVRNTKERIESEGGDIFII